MSLHLHSYWRSSASYRVRIALNLKGLDYDIHPVHLVRDGGEQHKAGYRSINPASLVPSLVDDENDITLNQSLSIIEYLDECYPEPFTLLPKHPVERARVRALAMDIACDIQPITNLRVAQWLKQEFEASDAQIKAWMCHWMGKGFSAIEQRLQTQAGKYCFDFTVSLADVCLVPQVYNATRYGLDMSAYPLISRIVDNCNQLDAFNKALPENQPDAQP